MSAATPARPRVPVAILGATGAVGQTFIRQLAGHPWFEIAELAASERSVGKPYAEAARWLEGHLSETLAARHVVDCDPATVTAPVVFSALDSGVAGDIEARFAQAGRVVLSNAKNYRMDPDVPLVIPEVNAPHLDLLTTQRQGRGWSGAIVTNANCAATVAALPLAALHEAFGVRRVFITTLQSISGAGYPGVPSLDIVGNVIPFIADEEAKIERELNKMLGRLANGTIVRAPFDVSAQANRVPTLNGHLACLTIEFTQRVSADDAIAALRRWQGHPAARGLPSSPEHALTVSGQPDRPQTRRDVDAGRGMTVTVGRIRPDPILDLRLVALGHNTVRGAAGGSILNAEVLHASGRLVGG